MSATLFRFTILQTSQALIKETLAARKNTSPQNFYETSQLYCAGALKIGCVGLQCIGFNNTLYRGLLEHAALCTHTGKWRTPAGAYNIVASPGPGLGLAPPWTAPGSPIHPVLSPPQMQTPTQSTTAGVGVIGRPPPGSQLQPQPQPQPQPSTPTPTYRILQHGAHDFSANSGERLAGTT